MPHIFCAGAGSTSAIVHVGVEDVVEVVRSDVVEVVVVPAEDVVFNVTEDVTFKDAEVVVFKGADEISLEYAEVVLLAWVVDSELFPGEENVLEIVVEFERVGDAVLEGIEEELVELLGERTLVVVEVVVLCGVKGVLFE